jgi:GT2 family glycosyltransferase
MKGAAKQVSVVILNWEGWRDTIKCVESVCSLDYAGLRILVCDNDSKDDSVACLRQWATERLPELNTELRQSGKQEFRFLEEGNQSKPTSVRSDDAQNLTRNIVMIETGANLGYAFGNNVGIHYALENGACDYVWILNNDTEVAADSLCALVERMEEDSSIGICGPILCYMDRPGVVQILGGGTFLPWKGRAVPIGFGNNVSVPFDCEVIEKNLRFVCGAAMLVSRNYIESIGMMQEAYFLYYEELDWAERGRGKFRLGFAPRALVYHKVGATIGTNDFGERSALSDYYLTRNRVRFCLRFSKRSLPFVFAETFRDLLLLLKAGRFHRALIIGRAICGLSF